MRDIHVVRAQYNTCFMLVLLLSCANSDRTISLVALFGAVTAFWALFCGGVLLIEALVLVSIVLIRW